MSSKGSKFTGGELVIPREIPRQFFNKLAKKLNISTKRLYEVIGQIQPGVAYMVDYCQPYDGADTWDNMVVLIFKSDLGLQVTAEYPEEFLDGFLVV